MQLRPIDIISWFRAKGKEFYDIADSLEGTFNTDGSVSVGGTRGTVSSSASSSSSGTSSSSSESDLNRPLRKEPVTIEDIKRAFGRSGATRVAILATKLNAAEADIRAVIESNKDIFTIGERGWIRAAGQDNQQQ